MFDTMTLTKAGAAVCGALLIFLFSNWAAEALYTTEEAEAHGETMEEGHDTAEAAHAKGYVIAVVGDENATEEEPEEEIPFADVYAAADAGKGERVFSKCKACHKLDGANGTGPHLDGVVGRAVASVDGFGYSDPMIAHGGDWNPDALQEFLANPKGVVPGTKMTFAGLKDVEDRANLIAYLATFGG